MEKPPESSEQEPAPATEEDNEAMNSNVEFEVLEDKDGEQQIKIMRTSHMQAETRAEVKRICNEFRLQLRAQVQLVPLSRVGPRVSRIFRETRHNQRSVRRAHEEPGLPS